MTLGAVAAVTDPGRKRLRNEDAYVCEPPVFAVADGMGGAQAGELASRLAAAAVREAQPGDRDAPEHVQAVVESANRRVYEHALEDQSAAGMGTTMTIALLEGAEVWIGHVGDSRAYLVRGSELTQLTDDHSLVAELVRSGRLSPEEAEGHPQRSVITRVLGTEPDVEVDVFPVAAETGDVFLICSDGLPTMVDDETIGRIVLDAGGDLQAAGRALVREANRNGGEDNITVVLFGIAPSEDTAEIPELPVVPGEESGRPPDAERTLTEADAVPAAPTEPPAPEPAAAAASGAGRRAALLSRRRRRRLLSIPVLGVLVLAIAALAGLAIFGVSQAYFVGVEKDGRLAVYQGLPWDLGGDVRLYRVAVHTQLLAAQLSQKERQDLLGHDLTTKSKALGRIESYQRYIVP